MQAPCSIQTTDPIAPGNESEPLPQLSFSGKYDRAHAYRYFHKHGSGFWRRLSNWRENAMARKALALAGHPASVLDLPCGTGRFWALLAEQPTRRICVADNSAAMIDVGLELRPPELVARIEKSICCSAFAIDLPDDAVDCVFSIRFLHHIQHRAERVAILREFARVSAGTVIVSLWVDGNYRAWRIHRKHMRRARRGGSPVARDRAVVAREQIAQDFAAAGLEIVDHVDFVKYWDKWRTYVLRVARPAA